MFEQVSRLYDLIDGARLVDADSEFLYHLFVSKTHPVIRWTMGCTL